jgi:hypothetical protein
MERSRILVSRIQESKRRISSDGVPTPDIIWDNGSWRLESITYSFEEYVKY